MSAFASFNSFLKESSKYIPTQPKEGSRQRIRVPKDSTDVPTITFRVLHKIYQSGYEGIRYTDIVKFIVEDIKGEKYQSKFHRGHWATNLTQAKYGWMGRGEYRGGILTNYCTKTDQGRWILTNKELIAYFNSLDSGDIMDPELMDTFINIINHL